MLGKNGCMCSHDMKTRLYIFVCYVNKDFFFISKTTCSSAVWLFLYLTEIMTFYSYYLEIRLYVVVCYGSKDCIIYSCMS